MKKFLSRRFLNVLCLTSLFFCRVKKLGEESLAQAVIKRYLFPHPTTLIKPEAGKLTHFYTAVPNWCHLPEELNLIDYFNAMRCQCYIGSVAFSVGTPSPW